MNKKLINILKKYREQKKFITDTINVGVEYSNSEESLFGVLLVEISKSDMPYRVQWYDHQGFSGHSEVSSINKAIELISDLGDNVKLSPGSMDKIFVKLLKKEKVNG